MRNTLPLALLVMLGLVGCERQVVGETFDGQRRGGRSLQVTGAAPPVFAVKGPNAPETEPPMLSGTIPTGDSDPAIRGQLLASGGLGSPSPLPRRTRPTPSGRRPSGMPTMPSAPGGHAPHPGH